MEIWRGKLMGTSLLLLALPGFAALRYVDVNSATPTPPYTNWLNAAATIQEAVDVADSDDQILVTNGVYQTGGRVVHGALTNRVAVTKAVNVRSVNGSAFTVIQGYQIPETTNGDSAVRCVYLTNGAVLAGFTLTQGATRSAGDENQQNGGGILCESTDAVVSNCVLTGNSAHEGGGAFRGLLYNCILSNNTAGGGAGAELATLEDCALVRNSAVEVGGGATACTMHNCLLAENTVASTSSWPAGGGAMGSYLDNCTITNNVASGGGGVSFSTLSNCTLASNRAFPGGGGGAFGSELDRCTLTDNSAMWGGGADGSILVNSRIMSNSAADGGGANDCELINCTLFANYATNTVGGAWGGKLTNCTLVGNSAGVAVGGYYSSEMNNGISFFNNAPLDPNGSAGVLNYCCTTPLPANGTGNFTNAPAFADLGGGDFHLQSNSPCINAGNNAYVLVGRDQDGNPRIAGSTVDIGAYEFQSPGSVLSYAWAQQFGLPTDGSADYADSDSDGMNNWREWRSDTVPTNELSLLQMLSPTGGVSGVTVRWQSVNTRAYFLEQSTNLGTQPPFSLLQSNIAGQIGTTSYTDTNAMGDGTFIYRVGVQQ